MMNGVQVSSRNLLTNIIVAHDLKLLKDVEVECPSGLCEVRLLDLSNLGLESPLNSNQLAEGRQYLGAPPSTINTKFVSFTSYRLPRKTSGKIGHHDMCKLLKRSNTKNVYAPYLIINSLERLITPPADAPSYAFNVPLIYKDLFRLLPEEFAISSISSSETQQMPMCNSFMCSLETYKLFHPFILKIMDDCWQLNNFSFDWSSTWSTQYPDRETGLLIERATALWFSQQKDLKINGPKWGSRFPPKILKLHPRSLGWRDPQQPLDNAN